MATLRQIAVHVEEPQRQRFAWVLSEREGDTWAELQRASATVDSFRQAMADGLLALQALVDDLEQGPRRTEPPPGRKRRGAEPQASRPKAFFGFGPAR